MKREKNKKLVSVNASKSKSKQNGTKLKRSNLNFKEGQKPRQSIRQRLSKWSSETSLLRSGSANKSKMFPSTRIVSESSQFSDGEYGDNNFGPEKLNSTRKGSENVTKTRKVITKNGKSIDVKNMAFLMSEIAQPDGSTKKTVVLGRMKGNGPPRTTNCATNENKASESKSVSCQRRSSILGLMKKKLKSSVSWKDETKKMKTFKNVEKKAVVTIGEVGRSPTTRTTSDDVTTNDVTNASTLTKREEIEKEKEKYDQHTHKAISSYLSVIKNEENKQNVDDEQSYPPTTSGSEFFTAVRDTVRRSVSKKISSTRQNKKDRQCLKNVSAHQSKRESNNVDRERPLRVKTTTRDSVEKLPHDKVSSKLLPVKKGKEKIQKNNMLNGPRNFFLSGDYTKSCDETRSLSIVYDDYVHNIELKRKRFKKKDESAKSRSLVKRSASSSDNGDGVFYFERQQQDKDNDQISLQQTVAYSSEDNTYEIAQVNQTLVKKSEEKVREICKSTPQSSSVNPRFNINNKLDCDLTPEWPNGMITKYCCRGFANSSDESNPLPATQHSNVRLRSRNHKASDQGHKRSRSHKGTHEKVHKTLWKGVQPPRYSESSLQENSMKSISLQNLSSFGKLPPLNKEISQSHGCLHYKDTLRRYKNLLNCEETSKNRENNNQTLQTQSHEIDPTNKIQNEKSSQDKLPSKANQVVSFAISNSTNKNSLNLQHGDSKSNHSRLSTVENKTIYEGAIQHYKKNHSIFTEAIRELRKLQKDSSFSLDKPKTSRIDNKSNHQDRYEKKDSLNRRDKLVQTLHDDITESEKRVIQLQKMLDSHPKSWKTNSKRSNILNEIDNVISTTASWTRSNDILASLSVSEVDHLPSRLSSGEGKQNLKQLLNNINNMLKDFGEENDGMGDNQIVNNPVEKSDEVDHLPSRLSSGEGKQNLKELLNNINNMLKDFGEENDGMGDNQIVNNPVEKSMYSVQSKLQQRNEGNGCLKKASSPLPKRYDATKKLHHPPSDATGCINKTSHNQVITTKDVAYCQSDTSVQNVPSQRLRPNKSTQRSRRYHRSTAEVFSASCTGDHQKGDTITRKNDVNYYDKFLTASQSKKTLVHVTSSSTSIETTLTTNMRVLHRASCVKSSSNHRPYKRGRLSSKITDDDSILLSDLLQDMDYGLLTKKSPNKFMSNGSTFDHCSRNFSKSRNEFKPRNRSLILRNIRNAETTPNSLQRRKDFTPDTKFSQEGRSLYYDLIRGENDYEKTKPCDDKSPQNLEDQQKVFPKLDFFQNNPFIFPFLYVSEIVVFVVIPLTYIYNVLFQEASFA